MSKQAHTNPPHRVAPEQKMATFGDSVHRAAIRDIATEVNLPLAEVELLYRELFVAMAARATITTFLPVLVTRKIRERYRSV